MLDDSGASRCGESKSKRFRRRRRSRKVNRTPNVLWLELVVIIVACCYGLGGKPFGTTKVAAFMACSPRMSTSNRMEDRRLAPQQLDATSLEVARKLIAQETSGSRRVTKKALLESIGYGVMDPLAYQTFENSPLPPKLRPTTHVRVAEGIHSFGQEFLGVPPRESVSSSFESAVPTPSVELLGGADTAPRLPYFALHPKLPGVGIRMTVLRLGNGELLIHSPVAPTVEILDMLRSYFPAAGPTTKMHLFSSSVSPEHWAFVKHWKEIFPSAEVWAVPGPHRRLMGVEVDHDIEHMSGVPGRLGGEVELAVLEGVPMVREALLLHRPTGTVLSAALLLAMDQKNLVRLEFGQAPGDTNGAGEQQGLSREAAPMLPPTPSRQSPPPALPTAFGQKDNSFEAELDQSSYTEASKSGKWRRLRWGLLDKTSTILNMDTLAVFAPVKTLLHAFKGNSAAFSSRVLGWDARIFVGCYGQSPLEGPELNEKLHAALGRYVELPKERVERKRLGTRLKALIPGRGGGQNSDRNDDDAIDSEMQHVPRFPDRAGGAGGGHRGSRGGGGALRPSATGGTRRQGADPGMRALPSRAVQSNSESRANYFASRAQQTVGQTQAESHSPGKSQTTSISPTETFTKTSASTAASGAMKQPAEARITGEVSPTDSTSAADGVRDASTANPVITADHGRRGFNLADMFSRWGTPDADSPSASREYGKGGSGEDQQATRISQKGAYELQTQRAVDASASLAAPPSAPEVVEVGDFPISEKSADISEVETRARSYLQDNKAGATRAVGTAAAPTPTLPSRTGAVEPEKKTGSTSTSSDEKKAADIVAEGSGNPLVVGPGSRYDERPAGSTAESEDDDPFEATFFPFADDGPFMNK